MEWMWIIYAISTLQGLGAFLTAVGLIMIALTITVTVAKIMNIDTACDSKKGDIPKFLKKVPKYFILPLVMLFVAVFIPSRTTMYTMIAASAVQGMSQNIGDLEGIEQVPQDLLDFVRQQLKDGAKN